MALRYQASSGAGEVVPPKPRQLPPLEAPAASSSTTTTTSLPTASCGRASPEAAEAGRGPLIPLVPGAPDAESVSGPLIPRAPEGPKTIGARPVPGRTSTVSLEPEDAPCAVVEARPTGPPRRSNSKSPRAFAETDPARFYCDLLYHQAEQQELWKQLDCSEDDADEMRIKRVDSSNFAVRRLEGHDAAGSRIFDPQALQRAHSYARAESSSRALSVDSGIFSEPDSDENDVDALPMVPTNSKHNHLQRRSSAFILDIIPKRLSNAQLDLQTSDGEEEPGTGDEPLGDAPGATSQSRKNSVSSRVGSRVGSITLPVEIPHPMRGLLTAKKVNLGELRRLLQGLEDLGRWMEAPLDALGDPYVPKPLVVAVAETNSSLVELLIEFQADFAAPFDGPSMYKGWVKPGLQLVESVSNRKGRFVGTMLADKLEKIEGIFVEAVRVADERARKEKVGDDSAADEHSQEHSTTIPVTSRSQDSKRHTIGHPREHYEIEDHLGDGDTSKVFRGWHMESKIEVAIKGEAKSDEGGIFDEINMMRTFRHPNIARLYETFETESQVFIVLELCAGGSLFDAVGIDFEAEADGHAHNTTLSRSPQVLRQMAEAVHFLHGLSICHRDIQIENFLLAKPLDNDKPILKLIDFTTAKDFSDGQELVTKICTPIYVAREILVRRVEPYTAKVDVWSLGVLFFIMLCGHQPFAGDTDFEVLKKVKRAIWKFEPEASWEGVPAEAKDLVQNMIMANPENRLSAKAVLEHPFLLEVQA
ncbi:unnamed protein product [Polarella glacialis]|uniref:Protein kinase domain-containing protein n=1 Tax=Polarella glacialis TaxID=89957 RepID=A0A813LL95_POLGL|nr:unnamed protein product [Polarella glacialis]